MVGRLEVLDVPDAVRPEDARTVRNRDARRSRGKRVRRSTRAWIEGLWGVGKDLQHRPARQRG